MNTVAAHLRVLYPDADAAALEERIDQCFLSRKVRLREPQGWSERDILLISYADTIVEPNRVPLQTLCDFMEQHLGDTFSGVHVLPYFPATSDDGFAVSAFRDVREDLGDWRDIIRLAERFDLMTDLVLNHCSREHPLARRLWDGDDSAASWFHLEPVDLDTSGITRPRATPLITPLPNDPQGRGVWTTFSEDQIDFNYRNPEVLLEVLSVTAQYLEAGTRLLRLDAVAFLWKELDTPCIHHPNTHRIVQLLRAVLDDHAPDCRLVTETNVPEHENLSYFGDGDEADMVYQFALPSLLLQALHRGSSVYLQRWLHQWPDLPEGKTFLNFIASHDGIGVRPVEKIVRPDEMEDLLSSMRRFGGRISTRADEQGVESPYEINITLLDALRGTRHGEDAFQVERMLCAHTVLLSLPGVPAFYVHSLLGSPNDEALAERTGRARSLNRGQLQRAKLEADLEDPASIRHRILTETLRRIRLRRATAAFAPGASMAPVRLGSGFLALRRGDVEQPVLFVCNLTPQTQSLHLDSEPLGCPSRARDLISGNTHRLRVRHLNMSLTPYQCLWLQAM